MAYKIKKSGRITEELELLGEDCSTVLTLHIDINVDRIASSYRKAQITLMKAAKAAKNGSDEALELYGKAVTALVDLIFGEDNTAKLLEYFDGKYTDMSVKCFPFIRDVIEPAVKTAIDTQKGVIAENYGLSRRQKRRLGIR